MKINNNRLFEIILVGDVVAVSLDSLPMTVTNIDIDDGTVECCYFDESKEFHKETFNTKDLIPIETTWQI